MIQVKIILTVLICNLLFCFNAYSSNSIDNKIRHTGGYTKKNGLQIVDLDPNRKDFQFSDKTIIYKDLYKEFYDWKKKVSIDDMLFIKKNTPYCDSREGMKRAYKFLYKTGGVVSNSGSNYLHSIGCYLTTRVTNGIGYKKEIQEGSNIFPVIFEYLKIKELSQSGVTYKEIKYISRLNLGFFYSNSLQTIGDARKASIIN